MRLSSLAFVLAAIAVCGCQTTTSSGTGMSPEPPVTAGAISGSGGARQNGVIEVHGRTSQPFRITIVDGRPVSVDGSAYGDVSGFSMSETAMSFTVNADTGSFGAMPTSFALDLDDGGGEYRIGGRCGSNCSGKPRHAWVN